MPWLREEAWARLRGHGGQPGCRWEERAHLVGGSVEVDRQVQAAERLDELLRAEVTLGRRFQLRAVEDARASAGGMQKTHVLQQELHA